MRVTQNQMTRQYLRNSNSALNNMNKINDRVLTQRKFLRASEDSVSAAKALIIRRDLAKCETYYSNLETAEGVLSTAEKSLLSISSSSTAISTSIIEGANGTQGQAEKKIIAEEIRNVAKEMLSQINAEYAGRQLFGGTNNSSTPYVFDEATQTLTYNGVDINTNDISLYPFTQKINLDIGLGMQFDASGNVDEQTVMDISLNGAKMLGYGVDADGDSKNLIALAFNAANALETGDTNKALQLLDKFNTAKETLMVSITKLGTMQQTVEYAHSKVENDEFNLQVAQQDVEGVDLPEEMTNYKIAEMAYNATLSMGSKIIPKSIFDFI